jgi:hypothetical protein
MGGHLLFETVAFVEMAKAFSDKYCCIRYMWIYKHIHFKQNIGM